MNIWISKARSNPRQDKKRLSSAYDHKETIQLSTTPLYHCGADPVGNMRGSWLLPQCKFHSQTRLLLTDIRGRPLIVALVGSPSSTT